MLKETMYKEKQNDVSPNTKYEYREENYKREPNRNSGVKKYNN